MSLKTFAAAASGTDAIATSPNNISNAAILINICEN
jgi:hypothetical protein